MPFLTRQVDEYVRQQGLHAAPARPCTARSLTSEEARAWDRSDIGWRLVVGVVMIVLVFGPVSMSPAGREARPWILATVAIVAAVLAFTWWEKSRRRRGYRDPELVIEVADNALTFTSPVESRRQTYDQLEITELLGTAGKSSRSFDGIAFVSPFGPIRLEDQWYDGGRAAAGAVLKRLEELGLAKPAN